MEARMMLVVDTERGIEWRALERSGGRGWTAQWRPARALPAFPSFHYREMRERFATAEEAMDFIKIHGEEITAGKL